MKKVILSLALVSAVAFTSCKKETQEEPVVETPAVETPVEEAPVTENAALVVPTFSNPEVQKFVEEYTAFAKEQVEVAKSGDVAKVQELAAKAQDWSKKSQEFIAKLTPEDAKLWADYNSKLAQELAQEVK